MAKNTKKKTKPGTKKKETKPKVSGAKGMDKSSRKVQLKPGQGFLDDEGRLCMTKEDLLEVELYRAKALERDVAAQKLHLQAEQMEFNTKLTVKALRKEALVAEAQAQKLKDDQKRLFNKLGPKYGVNFKKSTYDDETGIILVIDEVLDKQDKKKPEKPDETIN